MNQYDELYHYGVKGMKWGIRKTQNSISNYKAKRKAEEDAYRKKLRNISKNRNASNDTIRRARYRNQNLSGRLAGQATVALAGVVISEALTGNTKRYAYMSDDQLKKHLTKLAVKAATTTVTSVALNDSLAKSASKRYNDDGTRKEDTPKDGLTTKEQKIERAVKIASQAIPIIATAGIITMQKASAERAANEAKFQQWGGRILNESTTHYVYGSYEVE